MREEFRDLSRAQEREDRFVVMDASDSKAVLDSMSVPKYPDIYVLGCLERRVTIHNQQVRALNLAAALFAGGRFEKGDPVVIVGAGAAGLTCAAGLHRLGAKVTVFEQKQGILPLFHSAPRRWLHPTIYDWPFADGIYDHVAARGISEPAHLPILDWSPNDVAGVVKDMTDAWDEFKDHVELIDQRSIVTLGKHEDGRRTIIGNPSNVRREARVTILAVGFGLEPQYTGTPSYWERDDFDDQLIEREDKKTEQWLLSGCGDGGLVDLLRLCLKDFRHSEVFQDFIAVPGIEAIAEQIRAIERDPRIQGSPRELHRAYAELSAPAVLKRIKKRIRPELIPSTDKPPRRRITLNSEEDEFLTSRASALHRFLVGQLDQVDLGSDRLKKGVFDFVPGHFKGPEPGGPPYLVKLGSQSLTFDRVICRHGPKPRAIESFESVWLELKALVRSNQHAALECRRRWAKGIFGREVRPEQLDHPHSGLERAILRDLREPRSLRIISPPAHRLDMLLSEVRRHVPRPWTMVHLSCRHYAPVQFMEAMARTIDKQLFMGRRHIRSDTLLAQLEDHDRSRLFLVLEDFDALLGSGGLDHRSRSLCLGVCHYLGVSEYDKVLVSGTISHQHILDVDDTGSEPFLTVAMQEGLADGWNPWARARIRESLGERAADRVTFVEYLVRGARGYARVLEEALPSLAHARSLEELVEELERRHYEVAQDIVARVPDCCREVLARVGRGESLAEARQICVKELKASGVLNERGEPVVPQWKVAWRP